MALLQRPTTGLALSSKRSGAVAPSLRARAPRRANALTTVAKAGNRVGWLADHEDTAKAEENRKGFRTVYDFPNWQKHRSQFRLIDRLLQSPQSTILTNVVPSVTWVGLIGLSVCAYNAAFDAHMLPDAFPNMSKSNSATAFIQQTSAVLSLLLVFRTNASYGRWDEARKMWGLLLNRSRDVVRMGVTMMPDDEKELKEALARWTVANAIAMRTHFQPAETDISELCKGILSEQEIKSLASAPHRPVRSIHTMSQIVMNSKMDTINKTTLGTNITQFHDILGGCERLLRAPIPVSYTRHTARFLFMWLTFLPFALFPSLHEWTAPVAMIIAAALCGVEEIGVQCEEPFGILPLEVICNRVRADAMKTFEDDEAVKASLLEAGAGPAMVAANGSNGSNGRNGGSSSGFSSGPALPLGSQPSWVKASS